jgi:peptide/nickel transport system ATP-binding protein
VTEEPLALEVEDLCVVYRASRARADIRSRGPRRDVRAVDGVSFAVAPGECLGVVGESGSGKTTIGRAVTQQVAYEGTVRVGGVDLSTLSRGRRRRERRRVQMVFQNPYGSLNPMMSIGRQLAEAARAAGDRDVHARVVDALRHVGLGDDVLARYSHQFSGGQRQRLSIARAMVGEPDVIVLDEPFSALDVSIQAQILQVLRELKARSRMGFVLISHDLAAVRHLADRLAVVYAGQIVEQASVGELYDRPAHPYTKALLASALEPDPAAGGRPIVTIPGEVPDPASPPPGCRFAPRCPWRAGACAEDPPAVATGPGRWSRCHFADDLADVPWPVAVTPETLDTKGP